MSKRICNKLKDIERCRGMDRMHVHRCLKVDQVVIKALSLSQQDIDSYAEVSITSLLRFCKTNSTEFFKLVSNFLEVMENYTIVAAQKLHHQQKANLFSNNLGNVTILFFYWCRIKFCFSH